jgi:hypothetical protein
MSSPAGIAPPALDMLIERGHAGVTRANWVNGTG